MSYYNFASPDVLDNYFALVKISPAGDLVAKYSWSHSELYWVSYLYPCRDGAYLIAIETNDTPNGSQANSEIAKVELDLSLCSGLPPYTTTYPTKTAISIV